MRTQKWLRIIAINDVYELQNLPKLRTLIKMCLNDDDDDDASILPTTPTSTTNKQPDLTIVTLAGDFLSPSLLSALDRGRGMVDVLNQIPVNYVSFGNHEADLDLFHVRKRVSEYQGKWLNTNMPSFQNGAPYIWNNVGTTVPYDVLDLGDGIHVGLVGLLTDQPGSFFYRYISWCCY